MVSSVQEEYIRSFSLTKRFFDDLDAAANRNRRVFELPPPVSMKPLRGDESISKGPFTNDVS